MSLKATRSSCERRGDSTSQLEGQVLAEGHQQHPRLAVPSLYFPSAGAEDWKRGNFDFLILLL